MKKTKYEADYEAEARVMYAEPIRLIKEFYESEYEEVVEDFENINDIGLAFSTNDDGDEVQVSIDLQEGAVDYYVSGELIEIWTFHNYDCMVEFLKNLDFCALISGSFDGWIEDLFDRQNLTEDLYYDSEEKSTFTLRGLMLLYCEKSLRGYIWEDDGFGDYFNKRMQSGVLRIYNK